MKTLVGVGTKSVNIFIFEYNKRQTPEHRLLVIKRTMNPFTFHSLVLWEKISVLVPGYWSV